MLNFDAFIQNENEVTVLFYAEWFSPSLVLKEKLVSELAKEELLLTDIRDLLKAKTIQPPNI